MLRDTLKISCLIDSLLNCVEARKKHDEARENYDGYSWDYYGASYVDDMAKANADFEDRLNEYISERIREALGNG